MLEHLGYPYEKNHLFDRGWLLKARGAIYRTKVERARRFRLVYFPRRNRLVQTEGAKRGEPTGSPLRDSLDAP